MVPLATSYALAEAVGVERSVSRRFRDAKLFLGLFTAQLAIGSLDRLAPGNLIRLLLGTQVLNGLVSPILLTFILVLANRRSLMGANANCGGFRIVATICVVVVAALAVAVTVMAVL